jgi:hypothetical protein
MQLELMVPESAAAVSSAADRARELIHAAKAQPLSVLIKPTGARSTRGAYRIDSQRCQRRQKLWRCTSPLRPTPSNQRR